MAVLRTALRAMLRLASGAGIARLEGSSPGLSRQSLRHRSVAATVAQYVGKEAAILDVGCGQGQLSAVLQANGYTALHGCDWLPEAEVANAPEDFAYCEVDLNAQGLAAYGSASFDAIVCSDVLEHLENPAAMLREFARVLRPRGRVIVSLPNAFNVFERISWLVTGNSTRYKREMTTSEFGHISVLPENVLKSLAARAGLRLTATSGGSAYLDNYFILPSRDLSILFSYNIVFLLEHEALARGA